VTLGKRVRDNEGRGTSHRGRGYVTLREKITWHLGRGVRDIEGGITFHREREVRGNAALQQVLASLYISKTCQILKII